MAFMFRQYGRPLAPAAKPRPAPAPPPPPSPVFVSPATPDVVRAGEDVERLGRGGSLGALPPPPAAQTGDAAPGGAPAPESAPPPPSSSSAARPSFLAWLVSLLSPSR